MRMSKLLGFAALLFVAVQLSGTPSEPQPMAPPRHSFIDTFSSKPITPIRTIEELKSKYSITVVEFHNNGLLKSIQGSIDMATGGLRPEIDAKVFLNETKALWGFDSLDAEFEVDNEYPDNWVAFQQYRGRVLVEDGIIVVKFETDKIISVAGRYVNIDDVNLIPGITDTLVCEIVQSDMFTETSDLKFHRFSFRVKLVDDVPRLTWLVTVIDKAGTDGWRYIISAEDGSILAKDSICKFLKSEGADSISTIETIEELKARYPQWALSQRKDGSLYSWYGEVYLRNPETSFIDGARIFLKELAPLIGYDDFDKHYVVKRASSSDVEFEQRYKDVRVGTGTIRIGYKASLPADTVYPIISSLYGHFVRIADLKTEPTIIADSAKVIAINDLKWDLQNTTVFVDTLEIREFGYVPHLIWPLIVTDSTKAYQWTFEIDAHTGEVLRKDDGIET